MRWLKRVLEVKDGKQGTEGLCGLLCPEFWWLWCEQTFSKLEWAVLVEESTIMACSGAEDRSVLNLHQALSHLLFSCK